MALVTRRLLLTAGALAAAPIPAWARSQNFPQGQFTHGVASGDPLTNRVILWTRFVPASGTEAEIGWEIAADDQFARPVRRGRAVARAANDFCVKVDAAGLRPGQRYFYRFLGGAGPSLTGLTRTAPGRGAQQLGLALFSCSNLPFGHFHAYGHAAARDDIDLCLHVGDYIYEYAPGTYPSAEEAAPGRRIEPNSEIVRLQDYYQRYQSYRADPDLQEVHRTKPFLTVWDDHELTNDAWRDGAQNHQDPAEGTWPDRLAAASKAYFDWMPMRRPSTGAEPRIYRAFDWGDLARILMLDTRWIGRDRQLNYQTDLIPQMMAGGLGAAGAVNAFRGRLADPQRTLLGAAQEAWTVEQIRGSKARGQAWQVFGQQLVMGPQRAAPELASFLAADASPNIRAFAQVGAQLSQMGFEWNLDAWGGYPAARERLLAACAAQGTNALMLGGDSHNSWAYDHPGGAGGRMRAIELAGTSVTSPGFERTFTNAPTPGAREAAMRTANPQLAWCDLTHKGYAAVTLTRAGAAVDMVQYASIREPTVPAPTRTRLTAEASAQGPSGWRVG